MSRFRLAPLLLFTIVLAGACAPPATAPPPETLSVSELLGPGDSDGYHLAVAHRKFEFPEDHGPHDGFRTEWWYFTGTLADVSGRRFGYQLTFFRTALAPPREAVRRESAWATDHAFMAHFAVTDVAEDTFHAHERFSREALGLAGASADPLGVWLEDWRVTWISGDRLQLEAVADGISLSLTLEQGKAPVLQGDAGLSRKGRGRGNASYYYSLTRMPSSGFVRLSGEEFEVKGESWMDREWSTSVLEEDQVGWDWFSLQLDDGRDLMIYLLRRADGSVDELSAGTLIDAEGAYQRLTPASWKIEVLDTWTSPASGARYPASWRLELPAARLELELRPLVANQELNHTFRYWEGAVEARASSSGAPVVGHGYVELTGYN
jgi:predicted secreted hydrolase